ncbi:MAG TPA: DUF1302 family protein [Nevskiaceae bacterium]|nr:DUF1302 family protein [Nevskiaceae bacterium]
MTFHRSARNMGWPARVGLAAGLSLAAVGSAQAFFIPMSNSKMTMSLNTTVLYNLGIRAESQDPRIANSPAGYAESDRQFGQGEIYTSRLDITPEFMFKYQPSLTQQYGVLVSGHGWYDPAYSETHVPLAPGQTHTAYKNDHFNAYTNKFYQGPGGEFLDAFFFANRDFGSVPVAFKIGRLSKQWGPGLILGAQSISVNQQPTNVMTGIGSPGAKISQLFMPVGQVDVSASPTSWLSLSAQYFLEYEPSRQSEGGTYFGGPDFLFLGPDNANNIGLGSNLGYRTPSEARRPEFGIMAHLTPQALNTDFGFYFRRFNSKAGWFNVVYPNYETVFPTGTTLYGFSIDRNLGNSDFGLQVSYLHKAPLLLSGSLTPSGAGPRGNVLNVDTNFTWITPSEYAPSWLGGTKLWDTATILLDAGWQHLVDVTDNASLYNGLGTANCKNAATGGPGGHSDGCGTNNSLQLAADFTPNWIQALPNIDLYLPLTVNYTVYGNGVTLAAQGNGVNEGAISYSAGLQATYRQKYNFTVAWQDNFGRMRTKDVPGLGLVGVGGNGGWFLQDRGRVVLTFQASF